MIVSCFLMSMRNISHQLGIKVKDDYSFHPVFLSFSSQEEDFFFIYRFLLFLQFRGICINYAY